MINYQEHGILTVGRVEESCPDFVSFTEVWFYFLSFAVKFSSV